MNKQAKHLLEMAIALALAAAVHPATAQDKKEKVKLTPVKTTFVEGTQTDGKEGSAMVADGHKWTKWCLDAPKEMPYHVTLDVAQPTALQAYAFITADDTHTYPSRNPISWNIYGSNDLKEWQPVERVRYSRRMGDENEQTYQFVLKECKPWRYYKIEFTRMAEGTRIQLSEIELYR